MPIWNRHQEPPKFETAPPPAKRGPWSERLGRTGAALDRAGIELRELAVVTAGESTLVTGLTCHDAYHHGIWSPVTFRLDGDRLEAVVFANQETVLNDFIPSGMLARDEWEDRLARAGAAVDVLQQPVQGISVIQVDGGMVVNVSTDTVGGRGLHTFELTDAVHAGTGAAVANGGVW